MTLPYSSLRTWSSNQSNYIRERRENVGKKRVELKASTHAMVVYLENFKYTTKTAIIIKKHGQNFVRCKPMQKKKKKERKSRL